MAVGLGHIKKRKVKAKQKQKPDQTGYSDTVVSDSSAKNSTKKKKFHIPRSKSLASAFPAKEKDDDCKRRSKSLDDRATYSTATNLLKSKSHKSLEKLHKTEKTPSRIPPKPKKFNKVKEELEQLGINKNKKKCEGKRTKPVNINHVSFKDEKKVKKSDEYNIIRQKPQPNQNHCNVNGERTKNNKKSQKNSCQNNDGKPSKKNKKKNKKTNGFQKNNSIFS